MASVLSNLFSCGRARRTRATSTESEQNDANHASTDNISPGSARGIDFPTADALPKTPAATGQGPGRMAENVPDEVPQDPEKRDNNISEKDDVEVAVVSEKTKPSAGFMLERRLLVTATSQNSDTTELSTHVCEEKSPDPGAIPRPETPKVEDVDDIDDEYPFERKASEPELREVSLPVCATPEPEPEHSVEETPIAFAIPEPVLDEPLGLEPPSVAKDTQVLQKVAPVGLLELPTEVRRIIYEQMNEETPIRMCRYDDPALIQAEDETPRAPKRQFYNLTQVCHQIREEFLPVYAKKIEYVIDLWTQKKNLDKVDALKGQVAMDIDAACFDMEPIDLLPLIRRLALTRRIDCRFASTEGVVFRSIAEIVAELNKLLPGPSDSNKSWLDTVNGPIKRIDLHLFPHEDIRQYYRFRGAEPLLRIVYPSAASEDWMKRSSKSDGYEAYLSKAGLDGFEMHVVVGHASRRTTNDDRLPMDWRMSLQLARLSIDKSRLSIDRSRLSIDRAPRSPQR